MTCCLWRRADQGGQLRNGGGGDLGHIDFAALHHLHAGQHEIDALGQGDPETGHALVGDGQAVGAVGDQLLEERHDAAARAEHIAIAHHREAGAVGAGQVVGGDENLVRGQLGGAVEVDRVGGLVGRQRHDALDAAPQAGADHIFCAEHIGADAFEGIVFGGGDLLHGGGMDHEVHAVQRQFQPVPVAHVADEIADEGIFFVREFLLHLELLEFVAAKR